MTNYAERFGMTPEISLDNLARLLFAFDGAMTMQDDLSESSDSTKKELRIEARKNVKAKKSADKIEEEIRNLLFDKLQDNEDAATFLVDILRNLVDDVEDVEKITLDRIARGSKKAPVSSTELVEARNVAEWCKDSAQKMFTVLPMFGIDIAEDATFTQYLKKNDKGEYVLKLRNLKSGPKEVSSAGRDAVVKRFTYTVNGENVPTGMSMHEIAVRYCSTPTKRWDSGDLKDAIDKANEGKSLKETEKFTVTVPKGTLVGEIVSE